MLLHPKFAARDCRHCRLWQYDDEKGTVKQRDGQDRPRFGPCLCEVPTKDGKSLCPKGHWTEPVELSRRNIRAYNHYLECKATGNFPDDPIVGRNAGIIRAIEDAIERSKRDETLLYLRALR